MLIISQSRNSNIQRDNKRVMHMHTEDDLYYIENYSMWLDFYILLKTPLAVLRGKGAF